MQSMRRPLMSRFGALLTASCALFLFGVSSAQTQSVVPSADQLEAFRSMTPEQQQTILRDLGISDAGSGLGLGGTATSDGQRRAPDQLGNQLRARPNDGEEKEPLVPVVKGEDWVIIEIDFVLPPRVLAPSVRALYLSQGLQSPQNLQALQGAINGDGTGTATNATGTNPPGSSSITGLQLTDLERKAASDLIGTVRSKNPYQVSRDGVLTLPGFAGIPLLGLTEDQASMRLKTDPAFRNVDIRLTLLPLKKSGRAGLKSFGYDLFDNAPSTFAPVTNVPVPADYIVGPGDQLDILLYGGQNRTVHQTVDRNGRINLPEIGPVSVAGQLFTSVKETIEARVERQLIGTRATVSMADTRSIRVFVLGEARRAGSYTVSGLATITSALFAAGGVKPVGSLRNIQLKRQGALVRTLDLYDLLIQGDTKDDTKLQPGDVIFVPSIGLTASVDGEVRRPAVYEIKSESGVADLIQLAGGLTPEADHSNATLTRIDESQHRVVLQIDPTASGPGSMGLRNGDALQVERLRPTLDSGIQLKGHLFTQGNVAYHPGIRLSQVIPSVDQLRPNADIHYVLIRRERGPERHIEALSADLAAALQAPGSVADLELQPRDQITVFDLYSGRDLVIQPLMTELILQSNMKTPTQVVNVDGRVNVPGRYPLEPNMTVRDLIRAGGGLANEAYGSTAELTRYAVVNGERRQTQFLVVDLKAAMEGDPAANVVLQPFDYLSVREVPEWHNQESVTLTGEVRFAGVYAIRRGDTLRTVIARAGGLTEFAFPQGSVFTREELRRREQEQIDFLANRMQRDLAFLALQGAAANQSGGAAALSLGQTLMAQLRGTKAIGRLVIDLPRAINARPGSSEDIILRSGDTLIIPRYQQEVTVIGEVQTTTSHLFNPGLQRDDYIALSGGVTNRADRSKTYVVRANGSVVARSGSRWFDGTGQTEIRPGDTIVVPLDTERMPPLPFWQAVTSILYNVAIAVAAVHSL